MALKIFPTYAPSTPLPAALACRGHWRGLRREGEPRNEAGHGRVVVTFERGLLMQVKELPTNNLFILLLRASSEGPSFATEEFMDKLVLGVATLALSAGAASAQAVYPGYGYAPPYGYGYAATAPLYDYAGPADVAPAPHGYGPLFTQHQSTRQLLPTQRRRWRPAITQRGPSWFRSRYMTTHPVIGGAKDLTRPTLGRHRPD